MCRGYLVRPLIVAPVPEESEGYQILAESVKPHRIACEGTEVASQFNSTTALDQDSCQQVTLEEKVNEEFVLVSN